jgi:hypothetical protein
MNIYYRHGLTAGFFAGWAFGTLTTGYFAITGVLLIILAFWVFSDYWRGIASDETEHQP